MTIHHSFLAIQNKELKDYYWAYSDILRDIGINESTYDQCIMAFMALKLLLDNDKLAFNLEYRNNFDLPSEEYIEYKGKDTKENIKKLNRYLTNKGDKKYVSKSLGNDRSDINISQEIGFRDDTEELSIDALIAELDVLMKDMCDDYQKNGLFGF